MKNLMTLLVMLLAGGAGFVAHQYRQTGMPLSIDPPQPVEAVMEDLAKSEAKLSELYECSCDYTPEVTVNKYKAELQGLEASYAMLGRHETLEPEVERASQMIVMRSHFLAAKVLPHLQAPFAEEARRVIELRPDSNDAAVARVLLFCSKHDFQQPANRPFIKSLVSESSSYASNRHAVGLYSVVAHEFWKFGDCKSAEQVLETGIAKYKGTKAKVQLVHQLIDQGHREPPKPKFSQAQFARMQKALANSQVASSAIQFRS